MLNSGIPTSHISSEDLASYVDGSLSEDREGILGEHLAECVECTERAWQMRAMSMVWDQWTAWTHGQAHLRTVFNEALQTAALQEASASWRDRLARWQDRWAGKAEAAVRVVMEAPEKASRIVTEGLEALVRPEGGWQFAPAPGAIRAAGPRPSAPVKEAVAAGPPAASVRVYDVSRGVDVWLRGLSDATTPPLVLLVPLGGAAAPQVRAPEQFSPGEYLARFQNLPTGDYLVAFEPATAGSPSENNKA